MHRLIAPIVFSTILIIGSGVTLTLHNGAKTNQDLRAKDYADQTVNQISTRLDECVALMRATNAFFQASPSRINAKRFHQIVQGLDINERYPGLQGIGFAEWIETRHEDSLNTILQLYYDVDVAVWPETDQDYRTPIVLLEPMDVRNKAAIAYDMFSDEVRRNAIRKAFASKNVTASAPVELVQEISTKKQAGFLLYLPYIKDQNADIKRAPYSFTKPSRGLIYSPFRAGDLFQKTLEQSLNIPVSVLARDDEKDTPVLYKSSTYDDDALFDLDLSQTRSLDVAGRTWVLDVRIRKATKWDLETLAPYVSAVMFLLLAGMLAWITHSQLRAVRTAHAMHALTEKNLKEKELLLQEMKHRIKNSIARILAISRQTARHSDTIDDFTESFNARLQAMANAQDALTRSRWQRADLSDLLAKELEQVLGENGIKNRISGPKVELDETTSQALALTFHELATNALKYSAVSTAKEVLKVKWNVMIKGKKRLLTFLWEEKSAERIEAPTHKGFGTKLIDANIVGELNGKIERRYEDHGLTVEIIIPLETSEKTKS
ncbi:sensor domain CHASE1-containing protein [Cohaesibacter sp. ES.047]|uniref:CHASE domain-containing protein n=1 Tax=Cohaesibacter sp. ES.047 TaxID=1798205 RepID=UPI000BB7BCB3|nr:CHASE domain-containing protein [Cohaesibacter sp. ES.047]SNY91305.1 sensor domain CHASE1-containing protein [Cohaesibacter sp. ES.047]